jgi:hypothetical protein
MGIGTDSAFGRAQLAHGGGINGFVSDLRYFPSDSLSIAVLINSTGGVSPGVISQRILETIYGRWSPRAVAFAGNAADYAGEYRGVGRGREMVVRIVADSTGGLALQGPAQAAPLIHLGNDVFERGGARYTFVREGGRVTKIKMSGGSSYSVLTRR